MLLNKNVLFAILASGVGAEKAFASRMLTEEDSRCAKEAECFLRNLETGSSVHIGRDIVEYDPADSSLGFSIGCDVPDGKVEYVKYFDSGHEVSTQYFSPETYSSASEQTFWMKGDNNGARVNEVDLLEECGLSNLEVIFYTWKGGDENPCFTESLTVAVKSPDCETDAPVPTPTDAPVPAPTDAPVPAPTDAPVPAPTDAPVPAPTDAPVPAPTDAPVPAPTDAPVPAPTDAPVPAPTHAPVPAPTQAPVEPAPPQVANCYLWPNKHLFFGYNADIPLGTEIEVENSSGHRYSYPTGPAGSSKVYPSNPEVLGRHEFRMRFVLSSGLPGPWQHCINYLGTTNPHPPTDGARCFLWGNKIYLGKNRHAPHGYTVETHTVAGKEFSYPGKGQNFVYANDFRDYDSVAFYLRLRDPHGRREHWRKCVNYTPIALDIDGSGAVEHIRGEFIIDITADGTAETLEEWFAPTEGILINTNHEINDGIITGHHLFGDEGRTYIDGFEKLALLDANEDGEVSGDELEGLAIWVDGNSNAMLDDGELSSLQSHDIVSLSTIHEDFVSEALTSDGSVILMEDKWFLR